MRRSGSVNGLWRGCVKNVGALSFIKRSRMMSYPAEFMRAQSLIISLIVGAILGVLASMVVKGNRYGAIGDVITGIIGALVGGLLLSQIGFEIGLGFDPVVIDALVGSAALLFVVRLASRQGPRSG